MHLFHEMSTWDAGAWGVFVAVVVGVVTAAIALLAWLRPRSPKSPPCEPELVVQAKNAFPSYDLPGGGRRLGERYVGVSLYNRGLRPVRAVSWGIQLAKGVGTLISMAPGELPEPRLPYWIEPGTTSGTWYVDAAEVRKAAAERSVAFDGMEPWVQLDDGRRVSGLGVPLE